MKSKFHLIFLLTAIICSHWAFAAGGGGVITDPGAIEGKHFDPKGKPPSSYTVELQKALRESLPFEDKRDSEEATKGFIVAPAYKQIMAKAGSVQSGRSMKQEPTEATLALAA